MEEKLLLKVSIDEKGNTVVDIPNKDDACISITNYIWDHITKNDTGPLDTIFSIVVHMLAMNLDKRFEEQFIRNIKDTTPQYREGYRALRQQMMKTKS
ncbi:MAG: hypothetical protein MJY49_03100 [Bacteroidales bacterium]|nr:hypothetical protein [Bacteroidales bacterium]